MKMSTENNEQAAEEVIEKEIKLEEIPETLSEDSNVKETPKFVEKKQVSDLTDDEKALIISNAQNGIEQPFYDIKQLKNGRYIIIKKKEPKQTVSQKVVKEQPPPPKTEKKVYYSDNQLLFEHIIELNAKVEKLMSKHKKLKKRYQSLQNDIYIDDADEESHIELDKDNEPELIKPEPKPYYHQKVKSSGWRSQVTFI